MPARRAIGKDLLMLEADLATEDLAATDRGLLTAEDLVMAGLATEDQEEEAPAA